MKRMLLVVAVLGSQIFHSTSGSDGWFAYAESDTSTFYLNSNSIKGIWWIRILLADV